MTLHEQDIVNNIPISELLQNINARVFSLQEEIRRLKKKKPKWHKVADGDLPPIEGCCSIDVLTDSGRLAYYHYDNNCWVDTNDVDEIDPPKAWCEIPVFKEG